MKLVPDQIAPWVPGGLRSLGTDGFGRSDSREALRRHFEIDAETIALAVLYELFRRGELELIIIKTALKKLGINPEKANPLFA